MLKRQNIYFHVSISKLYEARETIPHVESGLVFHVFQSSKLIMILIFLKWLNNYLKIQSYFKCTTCCNL